MDDFNVNSLTESRNEYTMMLITKIAPIVIHGFESMFEDTVKLCIDNDEEEKCLMAFQNFLARVPKWNQTIITNEVERIKTESNCHYLEDLLTCVHVTHLKILTNVRVGQKQKKLELEVPQLDIFIHKVYIECARKLYKNVFLFETDIMPVQKQKYKRDIDLIIRECIMDVIRNNMPIQNILKAYLDETCEQDVYEEVEESFENIGETLPDNVLQNDITNVSPPNPVQNVLHTEPVQNVLHTEPVHVPESVLVQEPSIPITNNSQSELGIETETNINSKLDMDSEIQAQPQQMQIPQKSKEVQFIGDFKANEPSGYNTDDSVYNSDADIDADDEENFVFNDGPKLNIIEDKKVDGVQGIGTNDNITLEFEELN